MQGLGGLGLGGASKVPKTVVDGNTVKPEYLQIDMSKVADENVSICDF